MSCIIVTATQIYKRERWVKKEDVESHATNGGCGRAFARKESYESWGQWPARSANAFDSVVIVRVYRNKFPG
ncbi:hypothetical protein ANTRET_LOCUS4055 [Anthophora retusa]